jgi:YD repeat-containing protein
LSRRAKPYDALSRPWQVYDSTAGSPGTLLETHLYTPGGRALSFTDANGNVLAYGYDGFDRLETTTYPGTTTHPDATTEKYSYESNGNVLQKTVRSGQTIGFTYDALNRLATKTPAGMAEDAACANSAAICFGYDYSGRLLQALDASSSTPYAIGYDSAGRVASFTDQQARLVQVKLDGVGNRTQLT